MILPAAAAALLWIAATPPGWLPGAGWLVFPALALLYEVCLHARRPYRLVYAIGLLHLLAFSASLAHLAWIAYVAVAIVGAVYLVLLAAGTRWLAPRLGAPLAFACMTAAVHWLRAHAPEIPYPHGQPVHCLYLWPGVLGSVTWGGEVLGNLLIAGIAAAGVELGRSWRRATPPWGRAVATFAAFVVPFGLLAVLRPTAERGPVELDVLLVEPGFSPMFRSRAGAEDRYAEGLGRPTLAIAGPGAGSPPDLVVWPESGFLDPLRGVDGSLRLLGPGGPRLADGTMLIANTFAELPDEIRLANILLDHRGRLAALQWKRRLVPGGEYVPFLSLVPRSWSDALFRFFSGLTAEPPNLRTGPLEPPLRVRTRAGGEVRVGTLVCFENAFPAIAREQVAAGAEVLAVLSNESWFRRGAELDQMIAMTVCRALETGTPLLRATVDGATLWVDGDGVVREALPRRGAEDHEPRTLRITVPVGPGRLPSMAWIAPQMPRLLWLVILFTAASRLFSWARLLAVRPGGNRPRSGS